jgi:hypothetical protein
MDTPLINRVADSGIITLNLELFYPKFKIQGFDIKDFLFMELVLKEKDFRLALKELDWEKFRDDIVLIYCSTDAIVPVWAYMLISSHLTGVAQEIYSGSKSEFLTYHFIKVLDQIDYSQYDEKRVVIKGCSDKPVPPSAYAYLTEKLKPHAQSIMYGEPCSTVPIFKRPRNLIRK